MGDGELSAVTLGGKGSSLSSSSVYAVATGRSQTRIDSSALDRLSSPASFAHKITIAIPNFLTLEQSRAFLIVLLNKLLICNSPSRIPQCISEALNSNPQSFKFEEFDVTEEEHAVLVDNTCSALLGVSAVLDHQLTALSAFADVAAAFSCEALRADLTVFNLMDSGDGHTSKEEVGVAGDMRDLLNGSKLVGKEAIPSVIQIPKLHGSFREQAKLVHSKMRVELNSGHKLGSERAVCSVLFSLADALKELGECSFARAQSNLGSIDGNDLKSSLREIFGKECRPTDDYLSGCYCWAINLRFRKYYDKFAHAISALFGLVWKIVAWEFVTAYAVLDASVLNERIRDVQGNGESPKVDKKQKKIVLGKGTGFILSLIKGRLLSEKLGGVENSRRLETLVAGFLSFLDLAKPEFNEFLLKIKDYVESNESRRLPKIPKVSFLSLVMDMIDFVIS